MDKQEKVGILRMAMGAIEERVDYEVSRVMENILDLNTKPTAKRKITITLEFSPNSERDRIALGVTAKSALAPTEPVQTALCIMPDGNGEIQIAEMVPQIPGQYNMAGGVQAPPKILKLVGQEATQ